MGREKRRQYTADFKAEAVRMVVEDGRKPKEVAGRLGISRSMLTHWCQEQERRDRTGKGARSDEAEVRRRVRQLEQEREILKKRRFRATTDSAHDAPVAPNRLQRRFDVGRPNRVWVADITAIWAVSHWLYLAAVLDLFDRQVVGWALAGHMRGALVRSALQMAVGRRQPENP